MPGVNDSQGGAFRGILRRMLNGRCWRRFQAMLGLPNDHGRYGQLVNNVEYTYV